MDAPNSSSASLAACPDVPTSGFALPLQEYYNDSSYDIDPTYQTTVAMERISKWTFRWSQTTQITNLVNETASRDQQEEYLVGLLWTSFAVLIILLLWLLLLVFCKLWGPERVGFFSARRLRPPRPEEPTEALVKRELMYRRQQHGQGGGVPFQHNGIASGYEADVKRSQTKKLVNGTVKVPKQIVKGTIRAPRRILSKARKQKQKFDQKFSKRKKFARINSAADIELLDVDMDPSKSTLETSANSPTSTRLSNDEDSIYLMTQEDERRLAEYEVELKEYFDICEQRNARMRRVRVMVAFCALGMIIAAILFVVVGMDSLVKSVNVTRTGIQQLSQRTQLVLQNLQQLQSQQQQTSNATEKFILQVNEMCPNVATDFCSNVNDVDTRDCDFSSISLLEPELDNLLAYFDGTFEMVLEQRVWDEMQQDLETLQKLLNQFEKNYPTTLNWAFWVAAGCNLALAVISLAIFAAVMLLYFGHPLPQALKSLRSFVLIPTFLFLVVTGWIFSTLFIVASIGMTDTCIDSPDAVVLTLLKRLEDDFQSNSIVHDFLVYYVSGCPVESAPDDLEQRILIVTQLIIPALRDVSNALERVGFNTLSQLCGADLSPFTTIIEVLETQLCTLSQAIADLRLLLRCPEWYEIYQDTVHDGICYYSTTGFGWAASTQLAIVVLSMIILTLRVSYYELSEVADEGSGGCLRNWCCCVDTKEDFDDTDSDYEDGDDDDDDYDKRS